mgnify:CR=1 FL=1
MIDEAEGKKKYCIEWSKTSYVYVISIVVVVVVEIQYLPILVFEFTVLEFVDILGDPLLFRH